MNNRLLSVLAALVGVGFVGLAFLYWSTPAGSLPSVVPGYQSGSSLIHFKHGIGALLLGLAAFAFAWFQSGKKSQRT
jgi:hypothetical protein